MTVKEMTIVVTQQMKAAHHETARRIAQRWGVDLATITDVLAGATFGLGVTMMFESGYDGEQIVEAVRGIVATLAAPPDERGAS